MDFDSQLTQDFLFLLELCKEPQDVFSRDSLEYCLAMRWKEKLCTYQCDNLDQRRLRNVYMSHLCACLNEGQLKGPFMNAPPCKLEQAVDFASPDPRECNQRAMEAAASNGTITIQVWPSQSCSTPMVATTTSQSQSCPVEAEALSCGGASRDAFKDCTHFKSSQLKDQIRHPDCMPAYTTPFVSACDFCKHISVANSSTLAGDSQSLREDATELLEAIANELCGQIEPGSNPYLEVELKRYRRFIMNFTNMACMLEELRSEAQRRNYLLLNLQNDLVKLLNDNF